MAAALLMMVVGGLLLSAWVGLMSARAQQVVYMSDASKRRVSLLNSKMIGRQVVLQHGLQRDSSLQAGWERVLGMPDGSRWGGARSGTGWTALNVFGSLVDSASSTTVFPHNAVGYGRGDTFLSSQLLDAPTVMHQEMDPVSSYAFVKMSCPPLQGDLVSVYQKPSNKTGELDVHRDVASSFAGWVVDGRMVLKDPSSLFSASTPNPLQIPARVRSLYVPKEPVNRSILGTNSAGARLPPSNLAGVPSTIGSLPGVGANIWSGQLNVVRNNSHPENSLWHKMENEQVQGRGSYVTVDSVSFDMGIPDPPVRVEVQTVPTYPPPRWPSGYDPKWNVLFIDLGRADLPHVRVVAGSDPDRIHQVVFLGQAPLSPAYYDAALLPPVMVIIAPEPTANQSPAQDIRFVNANDRRWVLGLKGITENVEDQLSIYWEGSTVLESGSQNYLWRCILVNEYRTLFASVPQGRKVRFKGGLMTNWTFKRWKSQGTILRNEAVDGLTFVRDTDSQPEGASGPKFESLLPRDAWLESYFLPVTAGN